MSSKDLSRREQDTDLSENASMRPNQGGKTTHRKVLQLAWTSLGTKSLEAATEAQAATVSIYYLVTHAGQEVLQTIHFSEAQHYYRNIQ